MDVTRMNNDKKLELCRWYFRAGFAMLPFLWAINAVWFFKEAFFRTPYEEQKQIKRYVVLSASGALLFAIAFLSWTIVYQQNRAAWGEFGDKISFVIPRGIP